ncbi:hypothetical protein DYBT9275_04735 [Dyadobacter sp. CECT 9275]|uniref:DUF4440 domain-containing protein n=1 Tax=Dyadobacter helix TaxID=2822344 RepID=A0A916JJF3_9BACT|nr:nuclear transport factor 2 family protein [Dyadobacter sp. CECT 9275]CAG5010499.1 hypothetical protein DYBT9275_04735 [Dyadobacter sp. CECT 9275]
MKKFALSLLLSCSSLLNFAQTTYRQPADATDCSAIFFKALLDEDSNTLKSLLSDDFSVVGMDGQMVDRDMLIDAISEGYVNVQTGILSGVRTRSYGDVGVISGSWTVKATISNNSFGGEVVFMTVCTKSGGNWKVAAVQLTPIK